MTSGQWSLDINAPELKAKRNGYHDFNQVQGDKLSPHTNEQDNTPNLLVRIGRTKSSEKYKFTQKIWKYLISKGIKITAEYLLTAMNREVECEYSSCSEREQVETETLANQA